MRPEPAKPAALTRRALGGRFVGVAAAIGMGRGAQAAIAAPALDLDLRDATLRGLALAGHRGDAVSAAAANAALDRMAHTDPEGALLGRIYQLLDVRPAAYWRSDAPEAPAETLRILHLAIRASQPVAFGYTDLSAEQSTRKVLPLALVHPPQGVKLLAWCEKRAGFRQFFVRAIEGLVPQSGDFSADRLALLQGLLDKESDRA